MTPVRQPVGFQPMAQAAPAAPGNDVGQQMAQAALKYVGEPYVQDDTGPFMGPGGKNCSGLVSQAAQDAGQDITGGSTALMDMGQEVGLDQLQPGDMVYSRDPAPWGHVGTYIGNGQVVHASAASGQVEVADMQTLVDAGVFNGARRLTGGGSAAPPAPGFGHDTAPPALGDPSRMRLPA